MKRIILAVMALLLAAGCTEKTSPADVRAQIEKQGFYYTCSMHPQVREPKPGPCPICHMPMVREELQGHIHSGDSTNTVTGRTTVIVSPDKQQLIGVKTETVKRQRLSHIVRATATFEHDETKMAAIAPRFGGFARELYVNTEGQHVHKGDPLLKVYSPELLASENEFLLALRQVNQLKDSPAAESRTSAQQLLAASKRRLELMGFSADDIREVEQRGTASDELVLHSPVEGHVIAKMALLGKSFMAGETLYEVADLSHLWLHAFVYESELPHIKIGQKARVIVPPLGNKEYDSVVTFIYPHIDDTTRRGKLRLELENLGHELHLDMWANAAIEVELGEGLVVPAGAVIDTGERAIAFVDRGEGRLEPRELKLGARTEDFYEVREGLQEGEKVVTRALFLVDSESQLKAVVAGMGAAGEHHH